MVRMEAIAWVLNVCSALRRSQAETPGDLVAACLMVERVSLADRSFGRSELAQVCQRLAFHYLIRISPDVYVDGRDYCGKLSAHPVRKGIRRCLRHLAYRKNDPVHQHVATVLVCGTFTCSGPIDSTGCCNQPTRTKVGMSQRSR